MVSLPRVDRAHRLKSARLGYHSYHHYNTVLEKSTQLAAGNAENLSSKMSNNVGVAPQTGETQTNVIMTQQLMHSALIVVSAS